MQKITLWQYTLNHAHQYCILSAVRYFISGSTPSNPPGEHLQYNGSVDLEMSPICNGKDSAEFSLLGKVGLCSYLDGL